MENTDINNNNEEVIKPKKGTSEAQKRAIKKYHNKMKDNEEYKQKTREAIKKSLKKHYDAHKDEEEFKQKCRDKSKQSYERNKENVIARVRAYQRRCQEIQQLEKLHELKQQGVINFHKLTLKDNQEFMTNLEILGISL
jgi:hypothetical protein